mmetsp:Transcript_58174/g.134252  ORF Transcript_58174/g.134252 Transcript_58174/m.134252 type:complete len:218 (+) Transcript_58174:3068-3721(+)
MWRMYSGPGRHTGSSAGAVSGATRALSRPAGGSAQAQETLQAAESRLYLQAVTGQKLATDKAVASRRLCPRKATSSQVSLWSAARPMYWRIAAAACRASSSSLQSAVSTASVMERAISQAPPARLKSVVTGVPWASVAPTFPVCRLSLRSVVASGTSGCTPIHPHLRITSATTSLSTPSHGISPARIGATAAVGTPRVITLRTEARSCLTSSQARRP